MKSKAILLVLLAILITKAGNAQYEPQLLKDIEPGAVMTPEQEKLEVVNTLRNVGNGRNVFYVVKERSKPLFGLGQVIDGSFKMRLHLHKQYIDEISNANINDSVSQFVYIYKGRDEHYVYDLLHEKTIKLNLKGNIMEYHHEFKSYLGQSTYGDLFDICGVYCGEFINPLQDPGCFELDINSGKFVYKDYWCDRQEEIDLMNHPTFSPWKYVTLSGKESSRVCSYWIDFPQTNSVSDRIIKQWMSETISDALDISAYLCFNETSPKGMLDYYSKEFYRNDPGDNDYDNEIWSGYKFKFLRIWESSTHVTYLCSAVEDWPTNSWMMPKSYYLTFDKDTGETIDHTNVFIGGHDQEINSIIWTILKRELWQYLLTNLNEYFSEEDAKEEYNEILEYLGGEEGFEWDYELSTLALTPKGVLVHYVTKARSGTMFLIPYSIIKPYLATPSMEKDGKDVLLESVGRASQQAMTLFEDELITIESDNIVGGLSESYTYAYSCYIEGHLDEAINKSKESVRTMLSDVSNEMKNLTGEERNWAWGTMSYWYTDYLPLLAYKSQDEILLKAAYDALLLSKGILLNTENSFRQHIQKNGDLVSIELYNNLQQTKRRLQEEIARASLYDCDTTITKDLKSQILVLEKQLVGRSKRYGDFTRQMQISTLDVCLNMVPKTETAIEFACVSQNDSTHYLAFILNGKYTVPKAVYVCNGDELSNCIKNGIPDLAKLYHCVWERIEKEVELKEIISFSPIGQLHNLGIEYAQLPDGRLFSDAHTVCRYSSTREIVLKRDPSYREPFSYDIGGVALFGGIDYETAEDTKDRGDGEYINNNKEVKENIRRGALALDVSSFAYLPQTKTEIEQISDILKQAPNPPKIDIYEGSRGTENAFKDISGRKMFLIHTATHGFYFSGDDLDDDTGIGQYFSTYRKNAKTQEEMALSCSGLLLAGANQILNSGSAENLTDDGILTASEISTLDLSTVNMVVLSACQTACGELSGDGVFGLQRGFKKAGAKTLLMSLWQVDDRATQILMVEFYKNLLKISDNWTALKDAINYLRTTENGRYASPEYWAAFILLD